MDFRVFASKIVHAKLKEAGLVQGGYPGLRTVARWTHDGKAPPWVEQAMREMLGIETKAAPDWGRLQDTLDAIAEKLGVSLVAEAERSADVAVDEALEQPPAGGVPGDPRPRARHAKR